MRKNILILGFVLVILTSMSLVCFSETTRLILLGGQTGGSRELQGAAITEVVNRMYPEIIIDYRPGAGVANIQRLAEGDGDICFGQSVMLKAAVEGKEPYKEKATGLRAISSFNFSMVQIVALEDTGIKSIRQIIDEKMPVNISVGDRGSATELIMRRCLEEYGITYDDIESWGGSVHFKQMSEATQMMSAGRLDVIFDSGPAPLATFQELAASRDLKVLPIDEEVVETLCKKYGYSKFYITNENYDFVTTDKPTFGNLTIITVREAIPEEIVYKVTKAIGDNLDYFYAASEALKVVTQERMPQVIPECPLHPGAKRYYQEIGVLK